MKKAALLVGSLALASGVGLLMSQPDAPGPLGGASRAEKKGWIEVHLAGAPRDMGFQHGWLLAAEIDDALQVTRLLLTHDGKRHWDFFRETAKNVFWPRISQEYREEIEGIVEGLKARGVKADVWDMVAHNAQIEVGYYTAWLDRQAGKPAASAVPDRCSAFAATGSMTRNGRVVIGHNNWSGYLEGARWNIVLDLRPNSGHRILMDGYPGFIHSGDDFGLNSAGLAITETTISGFHGFDPKGVPEFVRARQAMQYSSSLDEFVDFMMNGNNGGYANAWLVADVKRNEIGRLELGLRNVNWEKKSDGYFVGANFPINEKLAAEETDFDLKNPGLSPNARRARWEQLMADWKGRIDLEAGKRFLADHHDAFENKADSPNERTLCGHNEVSPRGMRPWQEPFGPAGAVQGKIADATMVEQMEMDAVMGHPCGTPFSAAAHLKKHPEFAWMKTHLKNLPALGWARFKAR
jgi:hypothetical protein